MGSRHKGSITESNSNLSCSTLQCYKVRGLSPEALRTHIFRALEPKDHTNVNLFGAILSLRDRFFGSFRVWGSDKLRPKAEARPAFPHWVAGGVRVLDLGSLGEFRAWDFGLGVEGASPESSGTFTAGHYFLVSILV